MHKLRITTVLLILLAPLAVFAEDLSDRIAALEKTAAAAQASADNGWVLFSSALVLLMTVPGLALFYGGLVRQKNVISTMLKSLICVGIATILWALVGYSLVFAEGNAFIGGLDFAMLRNVDPLSWMTARSATGLFAPSGSAHWKYVPSARWTGCVGAKYVADPSTLPGVNLSFVRLALRLVFISRRSSYRRSL